MTAMISIADRFRWAYCACCYRIVLVWPSRWMPWPLLPGAGMYAYNATYADFRECMAWQRCGHKRPE